jgi:hypothetical protein
MHGWIKVLLSHIKHRRLIHYITKCTIFKPVSKPHVMVMVVSSHVRTPRFWLSIALIKSFFCGCINQIIDRLRHRKHYCECILTTSCVYRMYVGICVRNFKRKLKIMWWAIQVPGISLCNSGFSFFVKRHTIKQILEIFHGRSQKG